MQSEPIYVPHVVVTTEQRESFFEEFIGAYGEYSGITREGKLCACGGYIGKFTDGIRIKNRYGFTTYHSPERCGLSEADEQAECRGPYRKGTGVYVGCVNCEPYVELAETRDSPYLYGVQFNDFKYQVYDGDSKLDGVLEVKVGVGGYIIQVRQTPSPHMCPCYLLEPDDPEIEPNVCRAYIPGNNFRVEEID